MRNEYKLEKKKFIVEEIKQIYMFFDNYDYILIDGNEVKDISLNFCDYLIIEDNKICRVVESGFIKLQLSDKFRKNSYDAVVYNPKEYNVDKNQYVENRLCENRIKSLRVHDNNYWHDSILGNMQAEIKEGFIIINFIPNVILAPAKENESKILLPVITKQLIDKINLDFENTESFSIYKKEIVDMQLEFSETLIWGSSDYERTISNGSITFKIDPTITWREINSMDNMSKKKDLEKRLLGEHDICHLYITYENYGYGNKREECISVDDIRDENELGEDDYYTLPSYVGGICERIDKDTLIIFFGKKAKAKREELLQKIKS